MPRHDTLYFVYIICPSYSTKNIRLVSKITEISQLQSHFIRHLEGHKYLKKNEKNN
jgi:hypothetical protein